LSWKLKIDLHKLHLAVVMAVILPVTKRLAQADPPTPAVTYIGSYSFQDTTLFSDRGGCAPLGFTYPFSISERRWNALLLDPTNELPASVW
jgi:hypothetical protein